MAWLQVLACFLMFFKSWWAIPFTGVPVLCWPRCRGLLNAFGVFRIYYTLAQHRVMNRLHPSVPHLLHHHFRWAALRPRPRQSPRLLRLLDGSLQSDDGLPG
jgi:hypothetical protein